MHTSRTQVQALLAQAERRTKARMDARLATQRFDGGLVIHPEHLYVDQATGRRALRDLGRCLDRRPRARRGVSGPG